MRLFVILAVIIFYSMPAYAYLDPGTGSFVIQILIGAVLSTFFAVKMFWKKITAFVRRFFNAGAESKNEKK